jgi:hypothetical protein
MHHGTVLDLLAQVMLSHVVYWLILVTAMIVAGNIVWEVVGWLAALPLTLGDRCAWCWRQRTGVWLCDISPQKHRGKNDFYIAACSTCGRMRHRLERCYCGAPPESGNMQPTSWWRRLTWRERLSIGVVAFALFHLVFSIAHRLS